jgi:hypothetical protein
MHLHFILINFNQLVQRYYSIVKQCKESGQVISYQNFLFLWWEIVSPLHNIQSGCPSLVGCPWLLIQGINSYPSYLEALSSFLNLERLR